MIKPVILSIFILVLASELQAQKHIRNFIFGHSLINHAIPINPIPSQETSVPHWFASLARSAGNQYAVGGQYGFLPQHANLPPISQWGFDSVDGAWDSDNEAFNKADFNTILITPGNFIQWQGPELDYPSDPISPIEATINVIKWCQEQEPNLNFYIYENWPEMAPYLRNNFPPNDTEWVAYNDYVIKDFHDWFLEYHSVIAKEFQNSCVSFVPVGTLISKLLQRTPYDQIPISELYEDDAPHGRPTIYFLASLITYMTMYEESAPMVYEVDPIIHPLIRNNYVDVVGFLWSELVRLDEDNEFNVFCEEPITSSTTNQINGLKIYLVPNPTSDIFKISGDIKNLTIKIYNLNGRKLNQSFKAKTNSVEIDISQLPQGAYYLVGTDKSNAILFREMLVKI